MIYSDFVTQLCDMATLNPAEPNFVACLPTIITDAEQRCYRDLDLQATRVVDTTTVLPQGQRQVTFPAAFLVVEEACLINPVGQVRSPPLLRVSKTTLDTLWPSGTTGVPTMCAVIDNINWLFAPTPAQNYIVEVTGTQRPATLSAINFQTLLTNFFPDLFMAAALVYTAGFMKQFGLQSDDPQAGQTWEKLYKDRLQSALVEETRKKMGGK